MDNRPRMPLRLSFADLLLELSGWAVLIAFWAIVILSYNQLANTIPTHFGFTGRANAVGGKATIFVLPVLATALNAALTILAHFPHSFNYPLALTEQNAARQYSLAIRLIRVMKLLVTAVFAAIASFTISTALGRATGMPPWFLPVVVCAVAATIGTYIWRARVAG